MIVSTDPASTSTPAPQAATLQDDLRRAGIELFAWVITANLAAAATRDSLLVQRAAAEIAQIRRVCNRLANRVAIIPSRPKTRWAWCVSVD